MFVCVCVYTHNTFLGKPTWTSPYFEDDTQVKPYLLEAWGFLQ